MPYPTDPLDAVKRLLAGSYDLNASNPKGMVHARMRQEDNAEEDFRRAQNATSDGTGVSGAVGDTFAKLAATLNNSPNFGVEARATVDRTNAKNNDAILHGFGGSRDIAKGYQPNGEISEADAVGDGLSPAAHATRAASGAAMYKEDAPARAAAVKGQFDIQQEREKRAAQEGMFNKFLQGSQPPTPNPAATAPSPAQPPQSQSWKDFIMGSGPNSLRAAGSATSERLKYGVMSTPLASMIQNESFGNLEQLQAQFPGVRGFSYLLPKLREHQSHFGQGLQTPQASHERLGNMVSILDELEADMKNPQSHMAQAANGEWHITATPAAVQRALAAIHDTRQRFNDARAQMGIQYPELSQGQSAQPGAPPQAPPGRFTRLPE